MLQSLRRPNGVNYTPGRLAAVSAALLMMVRTVQVAAAASAVYDAQTHVHALNEVGEEHNHACEENMVMWGHFSAHFGDDRR